MTKEKPWWDSEEYLGAITNEDEARRVVPRIVAEAERKGKLAAWQEGLAEVAAWRECLEWLTKKKADLTARRLDRTRDNYERDINRVEVLVQDVVYSEMIRFFEDKLKKRYDPRKTVVGLS